MKNLFNKIINLGVKPNYLPWERHLTRKLNSISLISIFNVLSGIIFFIILDYTPYISVCVACLVMVLITFSLNYYKNYLWAAYLFFTYGFWGFFIPIILLLGLDSYIGLFYFPVIMGMIMLLGKKETFKHFIMLCSICILSIVTIALGYKFHIISNNLPYDVLVNLRVFNLIVSIVVTLAFTSVIVFESMKQEALINRMLSEKEILVAEVFHRVKNNMSIVISLLNLKKNISNSEEVKEALEECRNRVFSMELVHQNIFTKNDVVDLNFKTYIEQLTSEMQKSLGQEVLFNLDIDEIRLEVSTAIPCGLILNELITNSFKYAQPKNSKLHIQIKLKHSDGNIELEVKDNGSGITNEAQNGNTLGLELIKDLSKQLDGTYSFSNNSGLVFNLKFKC
jgi:two-component sensor histidine kinase